MSQDFSKFKELVDVAADMAKILVGTCMQQHGKDPSCWPNTPLTQLARRASNVLSSSEVKQLKQLVPV